MTITRTQTDISSLLGKVSFNQGQPNVDKLKADDARQLLSAMAKDSLNAGGNVKSGYFRVLTDKDGNITEIGRSSMSSKGRDKATELIKALVTRAFGDGSAELRSLTNYLEQSGDKVGSKSLVKLIAAQSIKSEHHGLASMESVAMKNQFTPQQQQAFSGYMQRIGQNVGSDTTGRLRLPDENNAKPQKYVESASKQPDPNRIEEVSSLVIKPGSPNTSSVGSPQSVDPYDPQNSGPLGALNSYLNAAGPLAEKSNDEVDPYEIASNQTNKPAGPTSSKPPAGAPVGTPDFHRSGFLGEDK